MKRRELVIAGFGTLLLRPAAATPESMQAAIAAWCGGAEPKDGRVVLEIAPLIDNGNAVPVTLRVESPMTPAEHVRELALFNEKNPNTEVVVFHLGPRCGLAQVATRIRLATSQQLVALAKMNDGSVWQTRVDVIVTLAACIES
ncbi:MAG: SoxY-related AACIE arm protein [Rubrivivax sp.]